MPDIAPIENPPSTQPLDDAAIARLQNDLPDDEILYDADRFVPNGTTIRIKVYLPNKKPLFVVVKKDATVQDTIEMTIRKSNALAAAFRKEYTKRKAAAEAANKAKAEAEAAKNAPAAAEESGVDFTHEPEITFDDFCKVELRVAEVRACENLKESKKLLHLTVFDGERERCILSGIAKWFKPEDLIGKKIGIVANLAPRPMMKGKYVSEGMIFAADTADGGCSIAFYGDNTPVGSRIH